MKTKYRQFHPISKNKAEFTADIHCDFKICGRNKLFFPIFSKVQVFREIFIKVELTMLHLLTTDSHNYFPACMFKYYIYNNIVVDRKARDVNIGI